MLTILLVEDHPLVVRAVKARLANEPDFSIVADTAFGAQAVELVGNLQPSVVVLDLALADGNGLDFAKDIQHACPQVRIIVFSLRDYAAYSDVLATLGIRKFISKLDPIEDLIQAIRFP